MLDRRGWTFACHSSIAYQGRISSRLPCSYEKQIQIRHDYMAYSRRARTHGGMYATDSTTCLSGSLCSVPRGVGLEPHHHRHCPSTTRMLWQMTVGEYGMGMIGQPQMTTEPSYAELWVGQRQPVLRIYALPSSRGAPLSPEDAPKREEQYPITVSLDVTGD